MSFLLFSTVSQDIKLVIVTQLEIKDVKNVSLTHSVIEKTQHRDAKRVTHVIVSILFKIHSLGWLMETHAVSLWEVDCLFLVTSIKMMMLFVAVNINVS